MADSTVSPQRAPSRYAVVARSPVAAPDPVVVVAGWEVTGRRSAAALTLVDLTPWAKVQVKADPGGQVGKLLGVGFGQATDNLPDGPPVELVVGSGPGEWLILAAPGTAGDLLGWCREQTAAVSAPFPPPYPSGPPPGLVSAIDLTHARALFRLTGERAADTLGKLCGIDLSDEVTGDLTGFRSAVAEVATDVVRRDTRRGRSYLLHCERSSGQYLFDCLLATGREYGIDVDGFSHREAGGGHPDPTVR